MAAAAAVAVVVVVVSMAGGVAADLNDCLYENDGYSYDLTALVRAENDPFEAFGDDPNTEGDSEYLFKVNICAHVECASELDPAGCQTYKDAQGTEHYKSMGKLATMNFLPGLDGANNGVTVVYDQGETCHNPVANRSTVVSIVCDPTVTEATLEYKGELTHCQYSFGLVHAAGCPIGGGETINVGDSGGGFFHAFGIIMAVGMTAFALYCCVGIIYNRRNGATEGDQIPNADLWRAILSCSCCSRGGSSGPTFSINDQI